MISEEDKTLISDRWYSLAHYIYHDATNFRGIKTIVDQLEDLFDNTKGIRKDIKSVLNIELQNIRDALSKKDVSKVLDTFDNLTTKLQTNLRIRIDPYYIRDRRFES